MTRRNPLKDRKLRDDMFTQGMLWCSKCRQFYPVKDFGPTSTSSVNYGYRHHCLRCEDNHRKATKDSQSLYAKKRNDDLKKYWVNLAGGKCQRCGFAEFPSALEFHHVYPALKKATPAVLIFNNNREKAWKELDKCCLLCRNCHIAYGAGVWRAEFIKRDNLLGWTVGDSLPLDDNRYEAAKPPAYKQTPLPLFTYEQQSPQLALFESRPVYTV